MNIVYGDLSKAEIKILLLIARYTISFDDRKTAPLSKADIERYTQLQGKTILKTITQLEEKGLIIKIKGDQYTANEFGLRLPENQEKEDAKGTYPADIKSTHFKVSSPKYSFKDSLSSFLKPTQLAELETRWVPFTKKEREREEKKLLSLLSQKPDEAEFIFKAFQIVLKEQDEYGEIKSAIAVLETNYSAQYRAKAVGAIQRQRQKENEKHVQAATNAAEAERREADAKVELIRMQCFQEAYPDMGMRRNYIETICRLNSTFTDFNADSPVAVGYAVSYWAQNEGSDLVLVALKKETDGPDFDELREEGAMIRSQIRACERKLDDDPNSKSLQDNLSRLQSELDNHKDKIRIATNAMPIEL